MREDYLQKRGLLELSISYGMDNLCLLEVGSFAGESMEIFNSTGLFKTIICVDTWSDLKSEHEFNSYSKMILVEHQFDQKKKNKFGNVFKFRGTLQDFTKSDLYDCFVGEIDCIYIDAMHTYEAVKKDIKTAIDIIKPRIAFSGHDYTDKIEHVMGVKVAVDEMFGKPDMVFSDNSWLKYNFTGA